jgi:NAD(P)-dependent dehydrogenase (short-subunit alcohol dehydrogenase family)
MNTTTAHTHKTALVTGANSGLGFEAAAQLATDGWGKIILACRSVEKAKDARRLLVDRTGADPFDTLAIDTSNVASALQATIELAERGVAIDFLLLNAGASSKEPKFNADGIEITYASTLVGHHVLTVKAVELGLLSSDARIVIAGSEGARGNLPGMSVHDVDAIADAHFGGDPVATIDALARLKTPAQASFTNMNEYVTAKTVVAWWAAALARRLPDGIAVYAVSPGSVVSTSFGRDMPAAMRFLMLPMMKVFGSLMGMNGPIEPAARRYLDAAEMGTEQSGGFFATADRKRLVGEVGLQTWPEYFLDERLQDASFRALVGITGVDLGQAEA